MRLRTVLLVLGFVLASGWIAHADCYVGQEDQCTIVRLVNNSGQQIDSTMVEGQPQGALAPGGSVDAILSPHPRVAVDAFASTGIGDNEVRVEWHGGVRPSHGYMDACTGFIFYFDAGGGWRSGAEFSKPCKTSGSSGGGSTSGGGERPSGQSQDVGPELLAKADSLVALISQGSITASDALNQLDRAARRMGVANLPAYSAWRSQAWTDFHSAERSRTQNVDSQLADANRSLLSQVSQGSMTSETAIAQLDALASSVGVRASSDYATWRGQVLASFQSAERINRDAKIRAYSAEKQAEYQKLLDQERRKQQADLDRKLGRLQQQSEALDSFNAKMQEILRSTLDKQDAERPITEPPATGSQGSTDDSGSVIDGAVVRRRTFEALNKSAPSPSVVDSALDLADPFADSESMTKPDRDPGQLASSPRLTNEASLGDSHFVFDPGTRALRCYRQCSELHALLGLQDGDYPLGPRGKLIRTAQEARAFLAKLKSGELKTVAVRRNGRTYSLPREHGRQE